MAAPAKPSPVHDLVTRGREALSSRRYEEARDLFDKALALSPDDPEVQSLAVTAEFWRRLARDGDGLALPPATASRLSPPSVPARKPSPPPKAGGT